MENQPSISSDLIRGHIDTIILHSLTENDKFAQQIADDVDIKSGGEYKINQATLYSSLKRLESLKLVASYWHDYEGGRRKFFNITEEGRKTVEDNLSSWVYSRSIIDKLMNASPAETVVEKIVEKPVIVEKIVTKEVVTPVYADNSANDDATQSETENLTESAEKTVSNAVKNDNGDTAINEREKNFRNILNGLIGLSMPAQQPIEEEKRENIVLEPIITEKSEKPQKPVQKFNTTINETDYNANKANFNGKIDYGDLTIKAEKEGYTLRISSKDSAKPKGNILINKLNLFSSLIVLAFILVEIGALYFAVKTAFDNTAVKLVSLVAIIPTLIFAIIYFCKKHRLTAKKLTKDGILIAAIIAFNLILLTFAFDFIFEINLEETFVLFAALIIPVIYYVNFVLFFVVRYILSTKKAFFYK